jgi:N-succinyldiaminopimelate aminotransferase
MTVPTTIRSPFVRLADLLGETPPGASPLALSVGEPQHAVPAFVGPVLAANVSSFNRYPMIRGSDEFRAAVATWLGRRYPGVSVDPARELMVLSGSREALLSVAIATRRHGAFAARGKVLMPNPYYPPYVAAAQAIGAEAVLMTATAETGFLPDLDALPAAMLDDTLFMILCSPANPQGAVASRDYMAKALGLARQHGFLLVSDECYSEIYTGAPPTGALEIAAETGSFDKLVVLNSLSKRSNLAGLRVGFTAGDAGFLQHWADVRNVTAPQVPLPLQAVAVAAYGDEIHVEASRALYRQKFDLAERILGNRFGPPRAAGGFFLWLDVREHGGDEAVTSKLWRDAGLRVVPGRYLGGVDGSGINPGEGYIRVALVHEPAVAEEALTRLAATLR